ncbi:MAG: hypothetical protein ACFB0A_01450 [Croceivirga sp.]
MTNSSNTYHITVKAHYHGTLLSRIAGICNKRRLKLTSLNYDLDKYGEVTINIELTMQEESLANLVYQFEKQIDVLNVDFKVSTVLEV